MTRLPVVAVIMIAGLAIMSWLLSGGLLRVLIAEPVLWLLVVGLPMVVACALVIPDRPRTVRVPVYVEDDELGAQHAHLHVHHHHQVTVHHVHVDGARVRREAAPVRAIEQSVVDGEVVERATARMIEERR